MAIILGVSYQAVDQWESGTGTPSTDTLIKIQIKAKERWARDLALMCLHLRYPNVFKKPELKNGNGSTPVEV